MSQRKRKVSWTPLRDGIFSGLIVFVAALASLLWIDWIATQYQKELIQGSLERTARGVAGLVNGDLHEKIIRDEKVDSDDYRHALAPLVQFHKGVPEVAYLYTLVVKDGELHFGLDTAEEAQQLGFKREMEASPVMETYHSKMPEEDAAEIAAIKAGKPYVSQNFFQDEYGTFLTALAPIKNSNHKVVGAVGIDLSLQDYLKRTEGLHRAMLLSVGLAAVTGILLGLIVWGVKRKSVQHQGETLEAVAAKTEAEERDRRLIRALGQIIYQHNLSEDVITWAGDCGKILGSEVAEMPLDTNAWLKRVHPDDVSAVKKGFQHVLASLDFYDSEYRYQRKDGVYLWMHDRGVVTRDDAGKARFIEGVMLDVTERKSSDERFRIVFEASTDPHMLVDANGVIDCNIATVEILGYHDKSEIIRQPFDKFWPEFQPDGRRTADLAAEMREMAEKKRVHRFEVFKKHASGALFPVEVSNTYITFEGRRVMLVVWHDLREIKQAEEALIAARDEAEAAGRAKGEFLAVMSHEIRTPMNGVIGFTQLLDETELSPTQADYVEMIRSSSDSLLLLLNDILDFSKMDAGHFQMEKNPFSMRQCVAEVMAFYAPSAQAKNIECRTVYGSDAGDWVLGDRARVRQVLVNLISNAIKFTDAGSVELRLARPGPNHETLEFTVTDTGIGILENQIPHIFKPFVQMDSSTTRKYGGTGLGLAICWRLVQMMGGKIDVASAPGQGARFSVHLPLEEISPPAQLPRGAAVKESKGSDPSLRVLVAEDNPVNRKVISHMLQILGYPIPDMAVDGVKCLEMATKTDYDLIFMDVQMPGLDGFQTTARLRELGRTVWICALTAAAMPRDRERCRDAGMNDYLTKPVTKEQIRQAIAKCREARPQRSA